MFIVPGLILEAKHLRTAASSFAGDLVFAAYVFADAIPIPSPRAGEQDHRPELVPLSVALAAMGESRIASSWDDRLPAPGLVPHPPDQTQYNHLRRLVPKITAAQLAVVELIAPEGRVRLLTAP